MSDHGVNSIADRLYIWHNVEARKVTGIRYILTLNSKEKYDRC